MSNVMILKDGTEIILEDGSAMNNLIVPAENREAMIETWGKLTADNLAEVQIKTGETVTATYSDLLLVDETSTVKADGTIQTVYRMREKTDMEKVQEALGRLEAAVGVHDGAITDLGEITSLLAAQADGEVEG